MPPTCDDLGLPQLTNICRDVRRMENDRIYLPAILAPRLRFRFTVQRFEVIEQTVL